MIKFNNININFEEKVLYKDFYIDFNKDSINFIMGESGIGKSTLLNYIKDELILRGFNVSAVFQENRLIPWINIYKNLEFVIKDNFHKEIRKEKIDDILEKMNLSNCKKLYPHELSGGMRQRINIARAMLYDGDVFIMDEPFKGLDKENKENIIKVVREYFSEKRKTAIIVSHDLNEAREIGDKIILFKNNPVEKEIIKNN
ncbi:ATP-binding cassette domain-containing protein [Clostridium sp. MB05]|uniref:ATP-binding cassette domain-containing protein n=1 Tax=Clostridium sp. MB05 TaxID=3376682 RepID=UPI003982CE52